MGRTPDRRYWRARAYAEYQYRVMGFRNVADIHRRLQTAPGIEVPSLRSLQDFVTRLEREDAAAEVDLGPLADT